MQKPKSTCRVCPSARSAELERPLDRVPFLEEEEDDGNARPVAGVFDRDRLHPAALFRMYAAIKAGRLRLVATNSDDAAVLQQHGISYYDNVARAAQLPDHIPYFSGEKLLIHLAAHRPHRVIDGDITCIDVADHVHVYVMATHRAAHFFRQHAPKNARFVLVTHNSDANVDIDAAAALPTGLVAWFAQNARSVADPRVRCLPIGIANSGWPHGDMHALAAAVVRSQHAKKKQVCYVGCDVATNPAERAPLKRALERKYTWQNQRLGYAAYLDKLAQYRYCTCPAGAGVDTHRFWECVYLGVAPVVKRSAWSARWREVVPEMIEVAAWSDVPAAIASAERARRETKSDAKISDVRYWRDQILEAARNATSSLYGSPVTHVHHCVVSDSADHPVLKQMCADARDLGWHGGVRVLCEDGMRIGHGVGHGMKILLLQRFIADLPDDDIVLFTDAHDVRVLGRALDVLTRFKQIGARIVFSAEKNCWPDAHRACEYVASACGDSEYKYLNSGAFIGYVGDLKRLFAEHAHEPLDYTTDDQRFFTTLYLEHQRESARICLDTQCRLFQSLFLAHADICPTSLVNRAFGTRPLVWHGNGGNAEGDPFFNHVVCAMRV